MADRACDHDLLAGIGLQGQGDLRRLELAGGGKAHRQLALGLARILARDGDRPCIRHGQGAVIGDGERAEIALGDSADRSQPVGDRLGPERDIQLRARIEPHRDGGLILGQVRQYFCVLLAPDADELPRHRSGGLRGRRVDLHRLAGDRRCRGAG